MTGATTAVADNEYTVAVRRKKMMPVVEAPGHQGEELLLAGGNHAIECVVVVAPEEP